MGNNKYFIPNKYYNGDGRSSKIGKLKKNKTKQKNPRLKSVQAKWFNYQV